MQIVGVKSIQDLFEVLKAIGVDVGDYDSDESQESQNSDIYKTSAYMAFPDTLNYGPDGWSTPLPLREEFTSFLTDNDTIRFNAVDPVGMRWGGVKDTANLYLAFQLKRPEHEAEASGSTVKQRAVHAGPKREYFLVEDDTDRVVSLGHFSHNNDAMEYAYENFESTLEEGTGVVTSLKDLKRITTLLNDYIFQRG